MKKRTALLAALLGGVVLLCAGVIWWQRSGPGGGVLARVYQRGELVEEIRLDRVRVAYSFPLTGEGGAENVVEVEPGLMVKICFAMAAPSPSAARTRRDPARCTCRR